MATPSGLKKRKVEDATDKMEEDGPGNSLKSYPVQELMSSYYSRLFPHQQMFKWLVYGNDGKHPQVDSAFFQRREFCFTMDGDIFVRYQSFKDGQELADAICKRCPSKIDIGPVYTCNPQDRLKFGASFQPVERELVFDIDLTDYDDVRTCGEGGHICTKCWPLMSVAIKIIDAGLREDFGFNNILWVYSGRRGVHCWVCDPSARRLPDEARASIANYFAVYKGHEGDRVKLALGGGGATLHPAVQRAAELLRPVWEEKLLPEQAILENDTTRANVLKYLPDEELVKEVERAWSGAQGRGSRGAAASERNLAMWRLLEDKVQERLATERRNKGNLRLVRSLERCCNEIIFAHAYPRLDMEVSKKMNHLLKAPFCVHPKTGKVCVPLSPPTCQEFDPDAVPTVHSLLEELGGPGKGGPKGEEWRDTSLRASVELFENAFLTDCTKASREELAAKSRAAAHAPSLAF